MSDKEIQRTIKNILFKNPLIGNSKRKEFSLEVLLTKV